MTKLYHDEGRWTVPGQQGKKAERHDVPGSPAELASWLNDRHVPTSPSEALADRLLVDVAKDSVFGEAKHGDPANPETHDEARRRYVEAFRLRRDDCPQCGSSRAGALALVKGEELDVIRDWIRECDELDWLKAVAEAVKARVAGVADQIEEGGIQ